MEQKTQTSSWNNEETKKAIHSSITNWLEDEVVSTEFDGVFYTYSVPQEKYAQIQAIYKEIGKLDAISAEAGELDKQIKLILQSCRIMAKSTPESRTLDEATKDEKIAESKEVADVFFEAQKRADYRDGLLKLYYKVKPLEAGRTRKPSYTELQEFVNLPALQSYLAGSKTAAYVSAVAEKKEATREVIDDMSKALAKSVYEAGKNTAEIQAKLMTQGLRSLQTGKLITPEQIAAFGKQESKPKSVAELKSLLEVLNVMENSGFAPTTLRVAVEKYAIQLAEEI